ncbi:hypothetical protein [Enterococcus faecium]|uniref:Uncharacterized protein n=1 Tax=Enterococcus faecium TaxID=1352 RepID=A0A242B0B8_ENTFC|nr:hypothetical protein [Enterococcus faecium]OTN86770.1 hypothetical protein A5810_002931 [Enterococcus faecium]
MEFLRVSKYNCKFRDKNGKYIKDEWTSYSDIGKKFEGKTFTLCDYKTIELKYINTVLEIAKSLDVNSFLLTQFEKNRNIDTLTEHNEFLKKMYNSLNDNKDIQIDNIPLVMKLLLREFIWGKLVHEKLVIHFGYDYYIYIGVNKKDIGNVKQIIKSHALFYEEKSTSPY